MAIIRFETNERTNIFMKKWLLILTAFLLTGCTITPKEAGSVSTSENLQKEIYPDISFDNSSNETTASNTENPKTKDSGHEYFCDKFLLTVDDKQFDLTIIAPELSSVSELYPITEAQLYILGRIDENYNSLMIYDFSKEEIIFSEHGTTMCWVQEKFETVRYLKDNVVYDFAGNVIYQTDESKLISMIEYVAEDFKVTVTDLEYENPEEIWIE